MKDEENELLAYFQSITKIGFREYIKKDSAVVLGEFHGKALMKGYVTDLLQFGEPTYLVVFLE